MATVTGLNKKDKARLENLEKRRSVVRDEHASACEEFRAALNKNDGIEDVKILMKEVEEWQCELSEIDNQILGMVTADLSKERLGELYDAIKECKRMTYRCEILFEEFKKNLTVGTPKTAVEDKEVFRLPQLEFKQFDGAPQNWLPFWNQFKRIHEDRKISNADKLQYLLQYSSGKVKELIESYPQLSENYPIVLKHVTDRFANEKVLIRHYVKEILNLILQNKDISLEKLYNSLETKLRALQTLGVTKNRYCDLLFPLVEAALPEDLLLIWHRQKNISNFQGCKTNEDDLSENDLDLLLAFLGKEVENMERTSDAKLSLSVRRSVFNNKNLGSERRVATASALMSNGKSYNNCIFCNKNNHESMNCTFAKQLNVRERRNLVIRKGACFCCLKVGHRSNKCKAGFQCSTCCGPHAALLCEKEKGHRSNEQPSGEKKETVSCLSSKIRGTSSFLPILMVKILGNGKNMSVRTLIDSGCQRSYILESVARQLQLKPIYQETITNCLFGGMTSPQKEYNLYNILISDLKGEFSLKLEVLGEETICNFVPCLDDRVVENFPEVTFSDCKDSLPVSLVLGADIFGKLLKGSSVINRQNLTALKTRLGWVMTGYRNVDGALTRMISCLKTSVIPSLWELEMLGIKDQSEVKSIDILNRETMSHFKENLKCGENGRYTVALPWMLDHPPLPDNRDIAEQRLRRMTHKLCENKILDSYQAVLDEWESLEIIEAVPEEDLGKVCHYLPHRPVIKLSKETTKVRPVFDASCAKGGFPSLNDCLSRGPNLLEMIIPLLIRFRLYQFGLVADIEKAFLQIGLKEEDRDFLRFLWWEKDKVKEKLKIYRHARLVFGVCSSPFLLNATISHHLAKRLEKGPDDILEKLASSFYVDDCVVSVDSITELKTFISVSEKVLGEACFNLRGWKHNNIESERFADVEDETLVLGIKWKRRTDTLGCAFQFNANSLQRPLTKRKLLSIANQIFDPIGFISPLSIIPKLLLQQVWKEKFTWDEELSPEISDKFESWAQHLNCLKDCTIPRWVFSQRVCWEHCSLHVFCDASSAAYAACVFLRAEEGSAVRTQLLLAKSRVAPLKELTIPRLELLGACIGVRLWKTVQNSLPVKLKTTFWTDSRVVLAWIQRNEPWNVFVRNRVNEIRENSDLNSWRHVPGRLNPADLPSRGCTAAVLQENSWWEGPEWLSLKPDEWPSEEEVTEEYEVNRERKKCIAFTVITTEGLLGRLISYFSSFSRIIRLCAWIMRWKNRGSKGELTAEEILHAEKRLLLVFQKETIGHKEMKSLEGFKLIVDEDGLLRVESKLICGEGSEDFRKPIVLVDHVLTDRLVLEKHKLLGHAGTQTTLSELREKYFVLKGRRIVKRALKACGICRRFRAKPLMAPEAPLPSDRLKTVGAFQVSGVDMAGPLVLKTGGKVWIAFFTCAVYRAVHLELVRSLNTEAFLMAFRRFIARRGRVLIMYSDNGKNFVGANNLLRKLDWNAIQRDGATRNIIWRFNPPAAPWWGGWWERLVGVLKDLLRKNLGKACLTFEELRTVLCDCEATINRRPLTYMGNEATDLVALTPAHFIQDFFDTTTVELDEVDREHFTKRMRYIQNLREQLRERFRKEYLNELKQRRGPKTKTFSKVVVGDLVLVEDENKKRVDWPLARVLEIIPGRDGEHRLVRLQLQNGQLLRPIQRVFPLEVNEAAQNSSSYCTTRSGRVVKPLERLNL